MFFNSLHFLVFLPIVTGLYFATPHRFRWLLLLAASYYFYAAWNLKYVILIVVSTLIDYFAASRMHNASSNAGRRGYLLLSIFSNLGLLFVFKYFDFARESFNELATLAGMPEFVSARCWMASSIILSMVRLPPILKAPTPKVWR